MITDRIFGTAKFSTYRHLLDVLNKMNDDELSSRFIVEENEYVKEGHSFIIRKNKEDEIIVQIPKFQ